MVSRVLRFHDEYRKALRSDCCWPKIWFYIFLVSFANSVDYISAENRGAFLPNLIQLGFVHCRCKGGVRGAGRKGYQLAGLQELESIPDPANRQLRRGSKLPKRPNSMDFNILKENSNKNA